jgi:hypothetical protein
VVIVVGDDALIIIFGVISVPQLLIDRCNCRDPHVRGCLVLRTVTAAHNQGNSDARIRAVVAMPQVHDGFLSPVGLVVKKRLKELFFAILHMLLAPPPAPSGASVADTQFPLLCDPGHKPNLLEFRVEGFLTLILVILLNQGSAGTEYRP